MAHTFVVLPTTRELYLLKMDLKYKSKYLRSWTSINKTKTNPSSSSIRSSDVLHDDTEVWCPLDFKTCPWVLVLVFYKYGNGMKNSSGNTPAPAWSKLKTNFSIISLYITEQCVVWTDQTNHQWSWWLQSLQICWTSVTLGASGPKMYHQLCKI